MYPSLNPQVKPLTHLAVVTETWPPEINGVAHTLQHLIKGLLIQKAVELATNPTLRQHLAIQARLSTQNLSWQRVAEALHQTLQTLLQELNHETTALLKCA